jgi:hypothetical protein
MEYDKYVKIPWFIILDRNICVGNKLLYGIIMLLSHKEGYCYADNKYLGNYLGVGPRRISNLLKELSDNNYIIMEYKHKFQKKFILMKKSLHLIYLKIFSNGLDVFITLKGHIAQ